MKIVIDEQKCMGSGECAKACPEKAISLVEGKAVIDNSKNVRLSHDKIVFAIK